VFLVEFRGSKRSAKRLSCADYFLQTCDLFYLHGLSLFRNQAADSICGSFCARNTGNAVPRELIPFRALHVVEQILLSTDSRVSLLDLFLWTKRKVCALNRYWERPSTDAHRTPVAALIWRRLDGISG
jgi:hypothetical protein